MLLRNPTPVQSYFVYNFLGELKEEISIVKIFQLTSLRFDID